MSYDVLDEKICHMIDQYKAEAEETINSANIDRNVYSCLCNLVSDNVNVLNNIRMAVSEYLESK